MKRDAATEAQVRAAEPGLSTWLAANAGSGKTRVLTDRVARLLLDGMLPEHILCLTYTKAAATEMQNRLFRRLGAWAMLDDDGLRSALETLGAEGRVQPDFLREARTLFARAIETPGGLRIQTIHSFCAALLRRFPLEARVSPQFQEMEDRAADLLRAEILDRMADGPEAAQVRAIAPFVSGDDPAPLLREITRLRTQFLPPRSAEDIRSAYGIPPGTDEETLLATVFHGDTLAFVAEVAGLCLSDGTGGDLKTGETLRTVTAPERGALAALEAAVLTQKGERRKKFFNKPLAEGAMAPNLPRFEALVDAVEEARALRLALQAAERDSALHGFAGPFLHAYEAEKARRGWLDFDDLITRARDLLNDPGVAAWVLYRLDGGIDHILVDEAQDTAPAQWDVIERLAQEFTAGQGARSDIRRTIFVVGDKKQSIYSFQGADPSEFDRMRAEFRARLETTDAPLNAMALEYSFRSAEPILRLVDTTFDDAEASGFVADQRHRAFKAAMPGRVDLWPVIEPVKDDEDGPWYEPLDRTGTQHHSVKLAQRIARFIRETLDAKTPLPVEIGDSGTYAARPVQPGDFLILVRGRQRLFAEIIRACKQAGLPIAGADRLKVMAELAVRDIVALLRFLATPEDSLSLATALRSPLLGVSEQALYTLAHHRTETHLWPALRRNRDDFPDVMACLDDLRGQTDFLRPYDLIDRILTRHKGRRLLLGRLGPEAEDGINALLGQALAYEHSAVPSLTGFLEWVQTDDLEIKRTPDSGGEMLRIMTVHGAKGLEAPIVILPDCAKPDTSLRDSVLSDAHGPLWRLSEPLQPRRQRAAVEAQKSVEAQERDRLLYVAMTRAEKWLIVAAAGDLGKSGDAWYDKVARGMERAGAETREYTFGPEDGGQGLGLGRSDWSHLPATGIQEHTGAAPDPWIPPLAPAPPAAPLPETRSPSDLGGAKALPGALGDTEALAKARGTLIHRVLEELAPLAVEQRSAAARLLQDELERTAEAEVVGALEPILDEALSVLDDPALRAVFSPDALAEVPVTASLPGIGRIHGVIDRLIVTPRSVLAVDFKSNRTTPPRPQDTPDGVLRQMGAYAAALAQVFPERRIETAIVWTATCHYMPLPHDLVTQALGRAASS